MNTIPFWCLPSIAYLLVFYSNVRGDRQNDLLTALRRLAGHFCRVHPVVLEARSAESNHEGDEVAPDVPAAPRRGNH